MLSQRGKLECYKKYVKNKSIGLQDGNHKEAGADKSMKDGGDANCSTSAEAASIEEATQDYKKHLERCVWKKCIALLESHEVKQIALNDGGRKDGDASVAVDDFSPVV